MSNLKAIKRDNNSKGSTNKLRSNDFDEYAKKVYGDFDTGQNPKAFDNFYVWDDNQRMVVYKRMTNEEGMIEEELYISNKEYDQKLGEFYNKLEEDEYKEDMN